MKHYTIPFFIPHKGCPHKCVFCNQRLITGETGEDSMSAEDISSKIASYLATMPVSGVCVQVGFFGGSFTGLSAEAQIKFLSPVKKFLENGKIQGIRLSTRPDLIDENKLDLLKSYGVTCIELGVQSMSKDVLDASLRGHSPADTIAASHLILSKGFQLAHQIMLGLPLSSYDKEFHSARSAVDLGAKQARIYPVIVIKGTKLAEMWKRNEYQPLGMEEALERAANLISFFHNSGVKVIRCGLHPSEGLLSGEEYLAGPFHPAFGHFARQKAEKMGCK